MQAIQRAMMTMRPTTMLTRAPTQCVPARMRHTGPLEIMHKPFKTPRQPVHGSLYNRMKHMPARRPIPLKVTRIHNKIIEKSRQPIEPIEK